VNEQFYVLLLLKGMIKGCFFLFYVIFKVIFYVFLETLCVSNLIPDSTCVRQDEKYKFKQ